MTDTRAENTWQRWKITIEYDGTDFCGWQRQKKDITIQECMEKSLKEWSGEDITLVASGRTDAGVHATGQVAHFDISKTHTAKAIRDATNFYLRHHPIRITHAEPVHPNFHARFHAMRRTYCYKILMDRMCPVALNPDTVWHIWKPLDLKAMRIAAKHFEGTHDFTSFRAKDCQSKNPIKNMERLSLHINDTYFGAGTMVECWAQSRSFLHHQIRNIVGTLKEIGEGKRDPNSIPDILAAKERKAAGITAPASGLHFVKVEYDESQTYDLPVKD